MSRQKQSNFWNTPLTSSLVKGKDVKLPEMLLGYFIGPVGGLLSSGIFTSILNTYFTDVLKLDLTFLTTLQLVSTIFIVIANLVVGQLIERTRVLAGKARPWILLSALTLSVASVLMFIVPFEGVLKMVWIAIAYNLYYSVAYPIYNTANSTLVAVSTRNSDQRGQLASFTNIAGLAAMGAGSMVFPILVSFALKENQALWFAAMLAVGILTALTVFLQYKFSRERVTEELMASGAEEEDKPKAASMGTQFKAVASEKWWWIVMIFYMLFQFAGAIKNGSMSYFCRWVLDNTAMGADAWGTYQSILAIMGAIPMAVAMLFVNPLCQKFGKRTDSQCISCAWRDRRCDRRNGRKQYRSRCSGCRSEMSGIFTGMLYDPYAIANSNAMDGLNETSTIEDINTWYDSALLAAQIVFAVLTQWDRTGSWT